ncbi:MAG: hypothetical protein IJT48_05325, partial [Bacteroidaceae bacterium]|nr:hypothetical protein [Bacteroidaceae bacterium]
VKADGKYSGLITGYAGFNAYFENCWGTGQMDGADDDATYFIRGFNSGTITNCYSMYGTQVNPITDEQVENGELCYLLNGDQSEIVWYQTIGEDAHPVFDASHKVVVKNEDGGYGNATGIEMLTTDSRPQATDGIYDLSGRKVSKDKLSKGIYIINGKKVAVK